MALNHNIFNRRNYLILAALAAGIFLVLILFRGCPGKPAPLIDPATVEKLQKELKQEKQKTDSLEKRITLRAIDLNIESIKLREKADDYKRENVVYKNRIQGLTAELKQAKAARDTAGYVQSCDSLAELAQNQQGVIDYQNGVIDSTFANYEERLKLQDSLLTQRAALNNKYETANQFVIDQVAQANKQYKDLNKKYRRERTLSRGLAGALFVIGILALTK